MVWLASPSKGDKPQHACQAMLWPKLCNSCIAADVTLTMQSSCVTISGSVSFDVGLHLSMSTKPIGLY
eukprot:5768985-Amphidinium_carterae.1